MSTPTFHRLAPVVLLAALTAAGAVHAQGSTVAPTPTQVKPAVDQAFTQLLAAPAVKQLLDAVKADHERSTVLDRAGLEGAACGCYAADRRAYKVTFG